MHAGVDAVENCAEGHAVFQFVNVGAAADGDAFAFFAGDRFVRGQKLLHKVRILWHNVGRNHARRRPVEAGVLGRLCRDIFAVFLIGHHRGAGVEGEFRVGRVDVIQVEGARQVVRVFIRHLDADAGAVGDPVGEELRNLAHGLLHFGRIERQL